MHIRIWVLQFYKDGQSLPSPLPWKPIEAVDESTKRLPPPAAKRSKFQIGGTWTDFRTGNAKFRDWPATLFYLKKTRQWADGSVEKYDSGCGCWLWIDNEFNNRERSRGTVQKSYKSIDQRNQCNQWCARNKLGFDLKLPMERFILLRVPIMRSTSSVLNREIFIFQKNVWKPLKYLIPM